jgi:hypothetical protein
MRLAASAHTEQPWQIHELRPQLQLLDVWSLDTPGGADDFPRLVRLATAFDPAKTPAPVRLLFAIRSKLGELLRLDEAPATTGEFPFTPILETDREWAGELTNKTVQGALHLGWVPEGDHYRGQLAVLVKPNGLLGRAYLAAISPFRHFIVYPALLRNLSRGWRSSVT